MAGYVPHHIKKRDALEKKEAKLRQLLAQGATSSKLNVAAEQVRMARIAVLQATRATIKPVGLPQNVKTFTNLDKKLIALRAVSADAIVPEFRDSRNCSHST